MYIFVYIFVYKLYTWLYISLYITITKKVKIKACLHSIYWIKIARLDFFEISPTFSLVVIGHWLIKLSASYLFLGKLTFEYKIYRLIQFCMNGLVLRMGIWQVHFIAFLMWWIREFQEGQFLPCNTAQLIATWPSKNACYFLVKESKNENLLLVLKNFCL